MKNHKYNTISAFWLRSLGILRFRRSISPESITKEEVEENLKLINSCAAIVTYQISIQQLSAYSEELAELFNKCLSERNPPQINERKIVQPTLIWNPLPKLRNE